MQVTSPLAGACKLLGPPWPASRASGCRPCSSPTSLRCAPADSVQRGLAAPASRASPGLSRHLCTSTCWLSRAGPGADHHVPVRQGAAGGLLHLQEALLHEALWHDQRQEGRQGRAAPGCPCAQGLPPARQGMPAAWPGSLPKVLCLGLACASASALRDTPSALLDGSMHVQRSSSCTRVLFASISLHRRDHLSSAAGARAARVSLATLLPVRRAMSSTRSRAASRARRTACCTPSRSS